MIVYLAGFKTIEKVYQKPTDEIYLLSSFWEHKNGKFGEYVRQERHILDSGAFTAINDRAGRYRNFDWDDYCRKYIAFIKATNQRLFFELDVDCAVGLERVEYYRKMIEDCGGIPPIPVWHQNRKWEYFIQMCERYPYVAIGTTSASEEGKVMRKNPEILHKFISTAHQHNAKIHGLGFTSIPLLSKLPFDSVDSTTWNVGGKYGNICTVDAGGGKQHKPKNCRVTDVNKIHIYNFEQWVKFQRYAERNL